MKKTTYTEELQKLLIEFILSDSNLFSISRTIIKPEYWIPDYRRSVEFIMEYTDTYKSLPSVEIVEAETTIKFKLVVLDDSLKEWFYNTIESFCKHKAMEKLVIDGPSLIEKGLYDDLVERGKKNILISLQKDLGTSYFDDPIKRLNELKDRKNMVTSGWKSMDKVLYGGLNRGELTFFAGGSGSGKSLFMQNIAINWVNMGLTVIYITLELAENLVSLRLDAMVTGSSTKEVIKDIDNAALKILSLKKEKTDHGTKPGILQIKKMSEAGTTVNDIRAYIKEFEIQTGKKVDGICVDYLDLLYPNSAKVDINNTFSKDKYTSEELRGLAAELNILCVSASQLNRCLTLDTEVLVCDPTVGINDYRKTYKKISEIQIGDYVLGQNDFVEVINVYNHSKQKIYKIELANGKTVRCTSNHRFLSDKGLRSIDTGLERGMILYTYRKFDAKYRSLTTEQRVYMDESEIVSIEYDCVEDTMDIEVLSETNLFFANDILTHNSSVSETDYDMSHIAGGISKINTADNVIAILTTDALRENGEYQLQFLKTRSSSGVGSRLYLSYNTNSLRIFDKIEDPTVDKPVGPPSKLADLAATRLKKEDAPKIVNSTIIKTDASNSVVENKIPSIDSRLDIIKKINNPNK